jgi:hypothetical protein
MASNTTGTARCQSLFAALILHSGEVLGQTVPRHTSAAFVEFLDEIGTSQPMGRQIHGIADNLIRHTTQAGSCHVKHPLPCCVMAGNACGKKNDSVTVTAPSGGSSGTQQLRVTYAGFVGQSFSAPAPTLCRTAACAVTPTKTAVTEGTYTYPVSDGSTYVIQGTLVGRAAPLGPPGFQRQQRALVRSRMDATSQQSGPRNPQQLSQALLERRGDSERQHLQRSGMRPLYGGVGDALRDNPLVVCLLHHLVLDRATRRSLRVTSDNNRPHELPLALTVASFLLA